MTANKTNSEDTNYLSSRKILKIPEDSNFSPFLLSVIEKLVGIEKYNKMMTGLGPPWPDANTTVDYMFDQLNISWEIENPEMLEELDDRPKVFVANHPYGLPDAFALFQVLTKYRPNVNIFANGLLAASKLEEPRLLHVDPFAAPGSRGQNRRSIATAMKHLRDGGDLALFPGRIVSHLKTSDWTISDSDWTNQITRFVEVGGGDLVPLHISGRNSMFFNLSGLIHPRIRTYMLLREFLRGGHNFTFKVGKPVSAEQINRVSRTMSVGTFARSAVYALKTGSPKLHDLPHLIDPELRNEHEHSIVTRMPVATSGKAVLAKLEEQEVLLNENGYKIFKIMPDQSGDFLDVIAEVRYCAYSAETAVNSPDDLKDRFDLSYHHLILWDEKKQQIIGVYRYTLPDPDKVPVTEDNLVTNSIFNLSPQFEKLLPHSMELGRAAIMPEYQKSYSPLLMLWRAILEIPRKDKSIRYVFGPVTMGSKFNPVSRELLKRFIMSHCADESMEGFVSPKSSLEFNIPREVDMPKLESACNTFSQLGDIVSGIEGGQRMLPVLFRHYANVGCRYIGFGEWKELDHATAGLTILNLKNISPALIKRYFGSEGAQAFLANR